MRVTRGGSSRPNTTNALLFACAASALLASTSALAAPKKQAPAATTSCDYNAFGRVANGQSLWAATGQYTVQGLTIAQMNCLLDQFAMNNFLFLVGNAPGGQPRFMSYAPWYSLFTETGAPSWTGQFMPLNPGELDKVKNQVQAGDGYVLKDVNSQITSYDIRVNQTFFNFVANNNYYKQSAFNAAQAAFNANSATGGIYFPPLSPQDTSEGAIELKTAWRYYGPMQKKRVTQKISVDVNPCPTDVMHCEQDPNGNFWGLVGFHLVQKTPDQPGFVWATFEHAGNAPDCAPGGNAPVSQNPISPATGKPMNVNGSLLNGIGAQTGWNYFNYTSYKQAGGDGKSCTYPTNQQTGTQCLGTPQAAGGAWTQVNVCRTMVLPAPTAANCANSIADGSNLKATACLNESVRQNFAVTKLPAKWMNYRLVGMQWLISGATGFGQPTPACLTYDETGPAATACPNYQPAPPAGKASAPRLGDGTGAPHYGRAGSSVGNVTNPANTTMETWMQYNVKLNQNASQTDCFGCHQPQTTSGSGGFGQGDFSHIFGRIRQK